MNGTAFDTLAAAKALREAGFEDRQAEAVAGVVRDAVGADKASGKYEWSDLPSIIVNSYMSMYGPAELRFWQRMLVALAGSITFFYAWWPHFEKNWPQQYQHFAILIVGSFLYAFLCSWKTHTLGPIRIYILSFLFPFFIWFFVSGNL